MLEKHFYYFAPPPFPLRFHNCEDGDILFEDKHLEVRPILLKHRTPTFGYLLREKPRELNVRKDKIAEYRLGIADIVRLKKGEDHRAGDGKLIPNSELTMPPLHRRSYAYVSDTVYDPSLTDHIRGVDLLFHEATFSHKDSKLAEETRHSTAVQAAEVAREAGAGKLIIGHFSTRYRDVSTLLEEAREVFPNTFPAVDGEMHSLPLQRETGNQII
jgi:ribonuclease Z